MTSNKRFYSIIKLLLLGSTLAYALSSGAEDKNSRLYRPVDNWDVDGANGTLYVSGSLTESPCRLAMTSAFQSVDMGNTETADLKTIGDKGKPIPFQIELRDCIEVPTYLENVQTGQAAWSSEQPAVKIRFTAPIVPLMPDLARVNGAQGIGLEISESSGKALPLNQNSNPLLLTPGQEILTYYVRPVRTEQNMLPNAYSALISFEMIYE